MDYQRLEKEIKTGICSFVEHIKPKPYWEDVSSFCLFTAESFMSLSLIFNTTGYFNKVKDINYPLTYKYSPSEWFSESLTKQDDDFIFNNRIAHFVKLLIY